LSSNKLQYVCSVLPAGYEIDKQQVTLIGRESVLRVKEKRNIFRRVDILTSLF
jgi:hypothetical protein